jgi:predicted nucleic acid-binding protein
VSEHESIVIDASAVAAMLFAEPEGQHIVDRIRGSRLAAPTLLRYEIANICWKKLRRHPERRVQLLVSLDYLPLLEIELRKVDLEAVVLLAGETGVTAYDAAYLWLARTLGVELVSLDQRLLRAAARIRGVP